MDPSVEAAADEPREPLRPSSSQEARPHRQSRRRPSARTHRTHRQRLLRIILGLFLFVLGPVQLYYCNKHFFKTVVV